MFKTRRAVMLLSLVSAPLLIATFQNCSVSVTSAPLSEQASQDGSQDSEAPDIVPAANPQRIAVGNATSCAIMPSGGIKCWGRNLSGQLGDGTRTNSVIPVDVIGVANAKQVAGGTDHFCALTEDSRVFCWGEALTAEGETVKEFSEVAGAKQVAAGLYAQCVITAEDKVKCWGSNFDGMLGQGTLPDYSTMPYTNVSSDVPLEVPGLRDIVQLAMTTGRVCALTKKGKVFCWGDRFDVSMTQDNPTPTEQIGLLGSVHVGTGYGFSCVLSAAGLVRCWGPSNVGAGINILPEMAFQIPGVDGIQNIAVGNGRACALTGLKTVKCWTFQGAIDMPGLTDVVQVALLNAHSCALTEQGAVKCWGANSYGQLGNRTTAPSGAVPVDVIF